MQNYVTVSNGYITSLTSTVLYNFALYFHNCISYMYIFMYTSLYS